MKLMRAIARSVGVGILAALVVWSGTLMLIPWVPRWLRVATPAVACAVVTMLWMWSRARAEVVGYLRGYGVGRTAGMEASRHQADVKLFRGGEKWGYATGWAAGYRQGIGVTLVDWMVATGQPDQPDQPDPRDAILARLREDAHNETGQIGMYARELLALLVGGEPIPAPALAIGDRPAEPALRWSLSRPADDPAEGVQGDNEA